MKKLYKISYAANMVTGKPEEDYVLSHSIGHVLKWIKDHYHNMEITKIEKVSDIEVVDISGGEDDNQDK